MLQKRSWIELITHPPSSEWAEAVVFCMTVVEEFCLRFASRTQFMVHLMTAPCSHPVAEKPPLITIPPPPCLIPHMLALSLFFFLKHGQKTCGLFRCSFVNVLRQKRPFPGNTSKQTRLLQSSRHCAVMCFNIEHAQWGLWRLKCSSGLFFSEGSTVWPRSKFAGCPLLGRLATAWIPNCLKMVL